MKRFPPLFSMILLMGLSVGLPVSRPVHAQTDEPAAPTVSTTEAGVEDAPANEFERWVGRLREAGATIPVLLLLSVLAIASILERAFHLWKGSKSDEGRREE